VARVNDAASRIADVDGRQVEEAGLNYLHSRRQLFYDGWVLFLSPGVAKRGRSVNAFFGSTLPLAQKIARCEATYAAHGLPALFRITPFVHPPALDAVLDAEGFAAFGTTLVQTAWLADAVRLAQEGSPLDGLELSSPVPEVFAEAVGTMRGSTAQQRAAHLERLASAPLRLIPVLARRDGATVAAGMVSVDGGIAGLFDIVTTPALRRLGLGTRVVAALLVKAWERGARLAFLQVEETNEAAIPIYRRFGFATRYTYHYRGRPGALE
jgi:ribosomal protein S18 acetylase RimI-like enzyme